MGRPTRIQFPGAIYHVTSRGNRRANIFVDERDHFLWLRLLAEAAGRFNLVVYGLCLMPNHFHLLVGTPDANISAAMHFLNGKYAQKFNWRHGLSGHVFQRRCHLELVERQEHLLELLRYTVLNPVRAQLVAKADDWRWSTHLHLSGLKPEPAWLNSQWVIDQFSGMTVADRIRAYRVFVEAGVGIQKRPNARLRRYFEPSGISAPVPMLDELERKIPSRDAAIVAAWACRAYSRDQIARHFNLSTRTVSRITSASTRDSSC
jgi:putative transposase